jgi:hypothetical protein
LTEAIATALIELAEKSTELEVTPASRRCDASQHSQIGSKPVPGVRPVLASILKGADQCVTGGALAVMIRPPSWQFRHPSRACARASEGTATIYTAGRLARTSPARWDDLCWEERGTKLRGKIRRDRRGRSLHRRYWNRPRRLFDRLRLSRLRSYRRISRRLRLSRLLSHC